MAVKCCGKVPLGCGGMPPIAVIGHRSSARTEHALPQNCASSSAGGVRQEDIATAMRGSVPAVRAPCHRRRVCLGGGSSRASRGASHH
eukprot:scaffold115991_cov63-Phaeocystis_antarctica.AAC.1